MGELENVLRSQLSEDLDAIASLLVRKDALPPAHVRIITSSILRKWLVDGWVEKFSGLVGQRIEFPTLCTTEIVAAIDGRSDIQYFAAGGVNLNGKPFTGLYSSKADWDGKIPIPIDSMPIVYLKASKLLRQKRVFFDGSWFTLENIIRFTSNKYGGIHFDPARKFDWERKLEAAALFFEFGNPLHADEMGLIDAGESLRLVLPLERGYIWNCLHLEMLAAAQAFSNARIDGDGIETD